MTVDTRRRERWHFGAERRPQRIETSGSMSPLCGKYRGTLAFPRSLGSRTCSGGDWRWQLQVQGGKGSVGAACALRRSVGFVCHADRGAGNWGAIDCAVVSSASARRASTELNVVVCFLTLRCVLILLRLPRRLTSRIIRTGWRISRDHSNKRWSGSSPEAPRGCAFGSHPRRSSRRSRGSDEVAAALCHPPIGRSFGLRSFR
jgi:hypothetical protein